jgi:hypothetical protein
MLTRLMRGEKIDIRRCPRRHRRRTSQRRSRRRREEARERRTGRKTRRQSDDKSFGVISRHAGQRKLRRELRCRSAELPRRSNESSPGASNLKANRASLGTPTDGSANKVDTKTDLTTGKKTYVVPVSSTFTKGAMTEEVTLVQDESGEFKVADYLIATQR